MTDPLEHVMSIAYSTNVGPGSRRLLAHCALMGRWERSPARAQLEQQLGREMARKLVYALVRPQAGLGGSSSP
jgi:hypothetical protein